MDYISFYPSFSDLFLKNSYVPIYTQLLTPSLPTAGIFICPASVLYPDSLHLIFL